MMLLAGLVGRANSCDFSSTYWARFESMLEFIASIMDVNGNVPCFGDSDDGVMVRWSPIAKLPRVSLIAGDGCSALRPRRFQGEGGTF